MTINYYFYSEYNTDTFCNYLSNQERLSWLNQQISETRIAINNLLVQPYKTRGDEASAPALIETLKNQIRAK